MTGSFAATFGAVTGGSGVSPMLLADRMLTLAQQADGAGLGETARRLLALAFDVFDEQAVSYRRDQTVLRLVPPSLPTSSAAAIAL